MRLGICAGAESHSLQATLQLIPMHLTREQRYRLPWIHLVVQLDAYTC